MVEQGHRGGHHPSVGPGSEIYEDWILPLRDMADGTFQSELQPLFRDLMRDLDLWEFYGGSWAGIEAMSDWVKRRAWERLLERSPKGKP